MQASDIKLSKQPRIICWWLICIGMVLAWLASPLLAQVQDQSTSEPLARTYFVDSSGKMTIQEVSALPVSEFLPFGRALSLGYTADVVWLKLLVDPDLGKTDEPSLDGNRLVLRLTNPLLNEVQLYDPLQNDGQPIITGDVHPNTQTELDLSSLTFLLPRGDEPREIYVSVYSTSSLVFSVVLEPVKSAIKQNRTYDLFAGVYLGLLVVFLVLAIALRFERADRVTNLFLVQQALAILWSLSLMGYTRQYLGSWLGLSSVDELVNVLIVLYTFSVCQFGMAFLSQFKLKPWARLLVYSPVVIFTPLVVLMLSGQARFALSLNALAIIAFSILGLVIVLFAVDWKSQAARALPRWLVTFFFVVFGFATPLATSVTLRVEPLFQNAFVGFFFTTALAGVLMSSLLLYRARIMARDALANEMALSLQRQRSQEQAKFLGMLAHEFKTPLSIIKMVIGSGQLDSKALGYSEDAIRNMDALLEKCLQAEALLDSPTSTESVELDLDELVRDVVAHSARPDDVAVNVQAQSQIRSDPTLVRIVLANMIDNALRYGGPDEPVQIRIYVPRQGLVAVRVTNAIGKSGAPDPKHVFDKYYRSPGARSQSGSGLGLYLSKHIAKLLGGDLIYLPGPESLAFELNLPSRIR